MQVDDVLRFTNLLKNLWRLYAIIPDDRKNDVYTDIRRVESRMSADTYTQVIDNLISLWPSPPPSFIFRAKDETFINGAGRARGGTRYTLTAFFQKKSVQKTD